MDPMEGLIAARMGSRPLDPNFHQPNPAINRLKQIEDYWKQFPGAAPHGTGPTGLQSTDSKGWSNLMNMQIEHQNLINEQSGKGPVQVTQAADRGQSFMSPSIAEDPYSAFNLNPDAPGTERNRQNAMVAAKDPRNRNSQAALQGLQTASPWGLG